MSGYGELRPDQWALIQGLNDRVGDLEAGCPPFIVPDGSEAGSLDEFQNGWDHAVNLFGSSEFERWGYRICDGGLEFQGHLAGGDTGTVAFTLPAGYLIFAGNPTFLTDIVDPDTGDFTVARVEIDMGSGDVTIVWPATV